MIIQYVMVHFKYMIKILGLYFQTLTRLKVLIHFKNVSNKTLTFIIINNIFRVMLFCGYKLHV